MNNRFTGLSLIAVSAASIAYQMVKQHRENVEAERQTRIELQNLNQITERFKESLNDPTPSIFNDALAAVREKLSGDSEESAAGQLI